jgi:ethanolamine ammonia-lyase large subunit
LHQAVGRGAIHEELRVADFASVARFRTLATQAKNKDEHLNGSELGSRLAAADRARLGPEDNQVQIVVSDGLSAAAAHYNVPSLLGVLLDALAARRIRVGQPMLVRYGRVKLAEEIADAVRAELVVYLLGERPGGDADAARSLSAYLVYRRNPATGKPGEPLTPSAFEYTVVSNIHPAGLPPLEAAGVIAERVFQILSFHAAGNRLEALLEQSRRA